MPTGTAPPSPLSASTSPIYDLGGGTFDASLLKMTGRLNEVVTSEGIRRLGGDDFDEAILKLVLKGSKLREPDAATLELLLEECAVRKEAVGPNTRRFLVDLSAADRPPFSCGIDEVYAACAPLVEKTVELLPRVLCDRARDGGDLDWSEVAGIYAVGGAGSFPLVTRMLRKSFGEKRVKRSPHPFAATAIGLAVFLDKEAGFALSERLTRHFGVFREAHGGEDVIFDPILPKDVPLPADGQPPLVITRMYRAAHNIGHFRFVECSRLLDDRPDGDVTPYDPVFFPFDPDLHDQEDLGRQPVGRREDGPDVEERYIVTPGGAVEVTLTTRPTGFMRTFRLRDTPRQAPEGSATATSRRRNLDSAPRVPVGRPSRRRSRCVFPREYPLSPRLAQGFVMVTLSPGFGTHGRCDSPPPGAPVPLDLRHRSAGGALRVPAWPRPNPLLVHHNRADPHARALDRLLELRQKIVRSASAAARRAPRSESGAVFAPLPNADHVMRTPRQLGGTAKRTRQRSFQALQNPVTAAAISRSTPRSISLEY